MNDFYFKDIDLSVKLGEGKYREVFSYEGKAVKFLKQRPNNKNKVDDFLYQERELIPFHLEYLLRAVDFCNVHGIAYTMDRIKYTKHFLPVFIDSKLRTTTASKSDKVAIFTDNTADISRAREYVMRSNMWVKSVVFTPPKTKVPGIDHPHWFETEEEVRALLKNTHYNYAFILNADKSILNTIREEYSLF